jgi:hypothetical protein
MRRVKHGWLLPTILVIVFGCGDSDSQQAGGDRLEGLRKRLSVMGEASRHYYFGNLDAAEGHFRRALAETEIPRDLIEAELSNIKELRTKESFRGRYKIRSRVYEITNELEAFYVSRGLETDKKAITMWESLLAEFSQLPPDEQAVNRYIKTYAEFELSLARGRK